MSDKLKSQLIGSTTGIPRGKDTTRPRTAFAIVMLEGFERLTSALRRGDPFSEDALTDMLALRRRYDAFSETLEARLQAHGMEELLEDDS
jgi:hypothetical protein